MRFPALAMLTLLLLAIPLAAAHGDEDRRTRQQVSTPVADVTVEHYQSGDHASCRIVVEGETAPIPRFTSVGRSCVGLPHVD